MTVHVLWECVYRLKQKGEKNKSALQLGENPLDEEVKQWQKYKLSMY